MSSTRWRSVSANLTSSDHYRPRKKRSRLILVGREKQSGGSRLPPLSFQDNRLIVRFAVHPVDRRHRPVDHLVFRAHAVGVHVPVSRDLAAGRLVARG
jgi:hypothetical protein